MLHDNLRQLGFHEKEIEVYLAIMRFGKATPSDIAKATKINRSTVYAVFKVLLEKGVVAEDLGGKTLYLCALSPDRLADIVSEQQKKLEDKKALAQSVAKELELVRSNTHYSIPKIRFVEEGDVEKFLYKQFPAWVQSSQKYDTTCWGFQDHTFVEQLHEWLEWSWRECPDMNIKLLSNQSKAEVKLKKRAITQRRIAFWKGADNFTATTWVIGDFLIMIMTRQHPFYIMEIHDPVLAHNQREVFKNIWKKDTGGV